ncbi:Aste57867_5227 [Aphanomyces stellatus]|uniref:Aste57867_5227 protein n=1 Tax=Aphanomyces stellatus TaxID=120398 RepID=A0A485KCN1_9STRA|nr:hypothetical protein As57867_005214 [Aphanomyces stellatus]VFT82300.1 Aste57867_5227 [Aphanomyces stellatus]
MRWLTVLLLVLCVFSMTAVGNAPEKDDHPELFNIRTLRNDALKLKDKGSYEKAADKLDQAMRKLQALHESRDDPKKRAADASLMAQTLNELGNVLMADKQYETARRVLVQAVDLSKRIFGPSHPSYSLALRNLAEVYLALDQHEEAIEAYKKLKGHAEKGLGKGHETVIDAARRMGESYEKLHRYKKAIKVYKKVLGDIGLGGDSIPNELLPAAHEAGVAELYQGLASCLMKSNQFDDALKFATLANKIIKRRDGATSMSYAFSLNLLAGTNTYMGRETDALKLLKDAQKIATKAHGENHPLIEQGERNIEQLEARIKHKAEKAAKEVSAADDAKDEL